MKAFMSLFVLSTLFIASFSQTTLSPATPAPTSCICDSFVANNYTNSAGDGCISGDDICYSCMSNECECSKSSFCGALKDLAEGLGTILIVIIVICVLCGLCCIGGIVYCVCAGAFCCAAAAKSNNGGGSNQMV